MQTTLLDILSEVACVVDDFGAMKEKLAEVTALVAADGLVDKKAARRARGLPALD